VELGITIETNQIIGYKSNINISLKLITLLSLVFLFNYLISLANKLYNIGVFIKLKFINKQLNTAATKEFDVIDLN
jgi:hypothetical protein